MASLERPASTAPPADAGENTLPALLLAVATGALAALVVLPAWLPALTLSLSGPAPRAYWYLARAAGFVSLVLLWLSMVLGLAITNRLARIWPGGPTAFALHQHTAVLGLAFALMHPLVLLGEHLSIVQILVPFASGFERAGWIGLGQIALLLLGPVTLSYAARRWLGHQRWRALHSLSFLVFLLAVAHGIASGTDTGTVWASLIYWFSGASVLYLVIYRLVSTRTTPSPAPSIVPPPRSSAAVPTHAGHPRRG
ncbi:MAG TPA: ferric reductase-like transmembrane domain-containing protein [Isosphaeraceae bacterium]|nr:ferric reductase-like transmembrane domain-containing protein [Isosphaeraceae bacterium]